MNTSAHALSVAPIDDDECVYEIRLACDEHGDVDVDAAPFATVTRLDDAQRIASQQHIYGAWIRRVYSDGSDEWDYGGGFATTIDAAIAAADPRHDRAALLITGFPHADDSGILERRRDGLWLVRDSGESDYAVDDRDIERGEIVVLAKDDASTTRAERAELLYLAQCDAAMTNHRYPQPIE